MDKNLEVQQPHKKKLASHKRKRLTLILAIAIVIVLFIVGLYVSGVIPGLFRDNTKLNKTELISKVNDLNSSSKSKEAKKLIESQTRVSYEKDADVAIVYAQTLASSGETEKAANILDNLRDNITTSDKYYYIGQSAYILQTSGQKDKAIEYYKQALALARAAKPTSDEEKLAVGSSISDYIWYLEQMGVSGE